MSEGDGLPTNPADLRLLIHALVDGELDAATALALERRIAEDPALAAEHARIVALQAAVAGLPRPDVSEAFRNRMAALGHATGRQAAGAPLVRLAGHRRLDPGHRGPGEQHDLLGDHPHRPDEITQAIASGHRRSLLAASPVDVASSDRHTVKPWLDARVGLSPPAIDLAKDGFALIGGRVEVIGDRPVPALVYRHHEHLITVVAEPQAGDTAPVTVAVDLSAGGFSLVHWTDGAFSYWAISDTERPELDDFVVRFRAAVR